MNIIVHTDSILMPKRALPLKGHANFYHNTLQCLGIAETAPPVADWLRKAHGLTGEWWVVTPVHWEATHNDAMIRTSGADLKLSEDEAHRLFEVFSTFVTGDGMRAVFHDAYTWLLQVEGKPGPRANPPHTLLNQSLYPHLNALDPTHFWTRWITEIQMLFNGNVTEHTSVNGVWIWGGGCLPPPSAQEIVVSSPSLESLARFLSVNVRAFSTAKPNKNALLLFDSMDQTIRAQLSVYSARWYWQNCAYSMRARSWFSILRGSN